MVRHHIYRTKEKKPADFFLYNSCGRSCLEKSKDGHHMADDGWAPLPGFILQLPIFIFLIFNKKPVYVINRNYLKEYFFKLKNWWRLLVLVFSMIFYILFYLLVIFLGTKVWLFYAGTFIVLLSGILYVYSFSKLTKKFNL